MLEVDVIGTWDVNDRIKDIIKDIWTYYYGSRNAEKILPYITDDTIIAVLNKSKCFKGTDEIISAIEDAISGADATFKIVEYNCEIRNAEENHFAFCGHLRVAPVRGDTLSPDQEAGFSGGVLLTDGKLKIISMHCCFKNVFHSLSELHRSRDSKSRADFEREIVTRERRLNTLCESLLKNLDRFRTAFDATGDLIFEYDVLDDRLTIDSEKFCKLFGVEVDDFTYSTIRKAVREVVHPEDKREFIKFSKQCLKSSEVNSIDYRIKNAEGEYVWFRTSIVPVSFIGSDCDYFIFRTSNINAPKLRLLKLRTLSRIDGLTELLNRRTFEIEVDELIRKNDGGTMIVLDIDNFKRINDTSGHVEGDRVLAEIAQKLKGACGKEDIVGRLGGDEFAVVLRYTNTREEVAMKIEQMLFAIRRTKYDNDTTEVTASAGAAMITDDIDSCKTLFTRADRALYRVKDNSKDGYVFYDDESIVNI